jgi:3-oxoadipate enol-lactonase
LRYVGVSLGGMVGLWLAAHAPQRITRLVVVCSSAHLPPPEPWAERAAKVLAAGDVAAVADAVLERWFTPAYARSHPEVLGWVGAMLRGTPAAGYGACCGVIERLDLRGELARITAPTLVVGAAGDHAIPRALAGDRGGRGRSATRGAERRARTLRRSSAPTRWRR